MKMRKMFLSSGKKTLLLKNENDEAKYPNLSKVVGCCLSLPYSNSSVERIFSNLRRIKTDIRSNLRNTSLVSILHVKNGLKGKDITFVYRYLEASSS